MLDIKLIRENPDLVRAGIAKKNTTFDMDKLLVLDARRRDALKSVELLKAERNKASEEIAKKVAEKKQKVA